MKLALSQITIVVFVLATVHVAACGSSLQPESLKGQAFDTARTALLKDGWVPAERSTRYKMDWEKEIQSKYQELDFCAVDRPVCSFSYTRKSGECLRIITLGEHPAPFTVDTIVHECRS